jgi:hypothetical protein
LAALRLLLCFPVSSVGRVWDPDLLVPGQAYLRNCLFSNGRQNSSLPSLGPGTSATFYPAKMRRYQQILTRYVQRFAHSNYSLVTVGTLGRGKLPFFVGAGGFEPRASWSQIISGYLFRRKKGDSERGSVHTAHTVHGGAEKLTQICHTIPYHHDDSSTDEISKDRRTLSRVKDQHFKLQMEQVSPAGPSAPAGDKIPT